MKKILSVILAFAVCFAFTPFMNEAKAAAYSAPQNVSVDWGGYIDYGSSLVVKYSAGADVQKAKEDGKDVYAQIDWKLTGPGVNDSWKYSASWDRMEKGIENNDAEYVEIGLYGGSEPESYSILDFAEPAESFVKYIPSAAVNSVKVKDDTCTGIDYNKYGVDVRVRFIARTYNEEAGEYSYENSDWSPVESYGRFSDDYASMYNLLINPDFEEGLTGWTNPDGKWGVVPEESGYGTRHGRFMAWGTKSASVEKSETYIYQDVSLAGHAVDETVVFNTLLCNYDQPPHDMGIVKLVFLDADGKTVETYKQTQRNPNWNSQSIIASIPEKAVTARAYLMGHRYVGSDIDAYYDYCSLVIKPEKVYPVKITEASNKSKAKLGDKLYLTADNSKTKEPSAYTWSSSYNTAATVDATGVVTMKTDAADGVAIYAKDNESGVTGVYWINSDEENGSSVVTSPAKPAKPAISSLTKLTKGFTVKWKKKSGVSGYQIRYSTSSKMTNAKTVTVKGASTVSKKITKLKAKKKYYVQIRSYKTVNGSKIYSSWSTKKYVTTK